MQGLSVYQQLMFENIIARIMRSVMYLPMACKMIADKKAFEKLWLKCKKNKTGAFKWAC
jgi:hypothetical protein